jgi:ParB/RepB/Spo0J family partition protein
MDVDPNRVVPNPENPRLVFREAEMNQLLDSISTVGIKVPLTMYAESDQWVLIDGERRWRCALRLNLGTMPAIIQPKPGPLENLLTMFNIHNVRLEWDLMPMAMKLRQVKKLLFEEGKPNQARDLSGVTGVPLPTVNRALELLELPKRYQDLLLEEAAKPKDKQEITADLFIEVNKSKRVVRDYAPQVFDEVSEEQYVDAMVNKYRQGVIKNVTRVRDISKIARAERTGGTAEEVAPILVDLVKKPDYRIEDAYRETVEMSYKARDIATRAAGLIERLQDFQTGKRLSSEVRDILSRLRNEIDRLMS